MALARSRSALQQLMEANIYYSPPSDKERLLFDFYTAELCRSLIDNMKVGEHGLERTATHRMGINPNVVASFDDAEKALLQALRAELLDTAGFAIAAEMRHLFDHPQSPADWKLDADQVRWLRNYAKELNLRTSAIGMKPLARSLKTHHENEDEDYVASYVSMIQACVKTKVGMPTAVSMAQTAFELAKWSSSYGGPAWANICKGWHRLHEARTNRQLYVAIDHIYDLQHNTGTVFTKLKTYARPSKNLQGHYWIQSALNFKANVTDPYKLIALASGQMQKMARYILKAAGYAPPGPAPFKHYRAIGHGTLRGLQGVGTATGPHTGMATLAVKYGANDLPRFIEVRLEGAGDLVRVYPSPVIRALDVATAATDMWSIPIGFVEVVTEGPAEALLLAISRACGIMLEPISRVTFNNEIMGVKPAKKPRLDKPPIMPDPDENVHYGGPYHPEDGPWNGGLWMSGAWMGTVWHDGIWKSGTWYGGNWRAGEWFDGIWKEGTWHWGIWHHGIWDSGVWEDGTWHDGTWNSGTWESGIWKHGTWKMGKWLAGMWEGGVWEGGTWEGGTWMGGVWQGGIWKGGSIFDPWALPPGGKLVWSEVSPKVYFSGGGSKGPPSGAEGPGPGGPNLDITI